MGTSLYKWVVIVLLWGSCFLNYADRQAVYVLFPLLRSSLNMSDIQLALVSSAFMWSYAAFGPFAGWLGDLMNRRRLILTGLAIWVVVTWLTILSKHFLELLFIRAIGGIAEAIYFPAALSIISDYHGPDTRSRAMSLHQSAVYVGTAGGGVLAARLGEQYGWSGNFIALGCLGVVQFLLLFFLLKEPVPQKSRKDGAHPEGILCTWRQLLSSHAVVRLILAFICANFVAMAFMVWLPTIFYTRYHLSLTLSGFHATIYLAVASAVGVFLGGLLADYFAMRYGAARMAIQICGVLLGVPFLLLTGIAEQLSFFILAMTGFGFCKGLYESNLWASLYDVVEERQRASATGLMNALGWAGGALAPLTMAFAMAHISMSSALSTTCFVYLLAGILLMMNIFLFSRKDEKMVPPETDHVG